jgi:diketogulonate reductase-like aldo/keto reductase
MRRRDLACWAPVALSSALSGSPILARAGPGSLNLPLVGLAPSLARASPEPLLLPSIGLGTCCDDADEAFRLILQGLAAGYRLIDTAGHYASEPAVGAALDEAVVRGILRSRRDVTVCTKIWFTEMGCACAVAARLAKGSARWFGSAACGEAVRRWRARLHSLAPLCTRRYEKTIGAARSSLGNLHTDQIDLLLVHFPGSPDAVQDPRRNRELRASTWRALEALRDDGLVRCIGVSNWSRRHLRETLASCRIPPAVLQTEVHPRYQQEELRGDCRSAGIQVMAHCPLGHGSPALLRDPTLARIAAECGQTPAQVALRWSVQKGLVSLPHSSTAGRLRENLGALGFELGPAAMAELDGLEAGDRAAFNPALIA